MCAGVRAGTLNARPRTQSSIAISSDGVDWLLVNASPDIRQQILAFPALQPGRARRDTGIRAVLLIDSQIDHATGLLMLRENDRPLELYCSRMVQQDLTTGFPVLRMLEHYCGVNWHEVPIDGGAPVTRSTSIRTTSSGAATRWPTFPENAEVPLRLKSPSSPWPTASCSRMPGHPGPSTTGIVPAGAGTASSATVACRTASRAYSIGRSPDRK